MTNDTPLNSPSLKLELAKALGWRFDPTKEFSVEAICCWIRPGNSDWQLERVLDYDTDISTFPEVWRKMTAEQHRLFVKKCRERFYLGWYDDTLAEVDFIKLLSALATNYQAVAKIALEVLTNK